MSARSEVRVVDLLGKRPKEILFEAQSTINLTVFPNPTQGTVIALLSVLEANQAAELMVKDIWGKEIQISMKKESLEGTLRWTLDFSENAKGVYFLNWKGEGIDRTERLMVYGYPSRVPVKGTPTILIPECVNLNHD